MTIEFLLGTICGSLIGLTVGFLMGYDLMRTERKW